ncbi:MAG: PTS sugar transporter subunit IIA [Firmicutes bacterium]|nr:PTS sugar transporter subunit IIA [Bacillota bacterium]
MRLAENGGDTDLRVSPEEEAFLNREDRPVTEPDPATNGLPSLLTEDRVQIGRLARDWREALKVASSPLVRNGDVTPEYVHAMIGMVEALGPYIVVAPGVALAHARPEQGVQRLCVSITVLVEPVPFGSVNDPVWLICIFGAVDNRSHVLLLSQLASLLSEERDVKSLRLAREPRHLLDIVKRRFS